MGMFDKIFGGEKHSIDRFVGGDKKGQKDLRQKADRAFKGHKEVAEVERPKTPEELEMIELANRETDRLREKYGLPEYRVPSENYHVIRKEKSDAVLRGANGHFSLRGQGIAVVEEENRSLALARLFHETVHFKSFASLNVADPSERRVGLSAAVEGEKDRAFTPLNEAVTEELSKRFMRGQEGSDLLKKDTVNMIRGRGHYGAEVMEDICAVKVGPDRDDPEKVYVERFRFAYPMERQALHLLIDKLKERNPKTFRDKDEWFDMFAGAMFNGHLLELARAVESTFGKGKFREMGEKKDGKEFLEFVESL